MSLTPLPPAENLAALLAWLTHTLVTWGLVGRLARPLLGPLVDRIRNINIAVGRIAARVGAGRYTPRIVTTRRRPVIKPRRKNPLPQGVGWLIKLLPETVGAIGQLETLFRDPEMQALMAAAPNSLGRPLRSLCRMLAVAVPATIAAPARPRKPRSARPPKPRPPPRPPQQEGPAWMRLGPPRKPWSMTRMVGAKRRP